MQLPNCWPWHLRWFRVLAVLLLPVTVAALYVHVVIWLSWFSAVLIWEGSEGLRKHGWLP